LGDISIQGLSTGDTGLVNSATARFLFLDGVCTSETIITEVSITISFEAVLLLSTRITGGQEGARPTDGGEGGTIEKAPLADHESGWAVPTLVGEVVAEANMAEGVEHATTGEAGSSHKSTNDTLELGECGCACCVGGVSSSRGAVKVPFTGLGTRDCVEVPHTCSSPESSLEIEIISLPLLGVETTTAGLEAANRLWPLDLGWNVADKCRWPAARKGEAILL